jgi:hypothetical protein
MAIDWFQALVEIEIQATVDPYYYGGDYAGSDQFASALQDMALRAQFDKQVWRINNLLKAALNERPGKPGELGRNQAQIRAVGEGIHAETFRRLKGRANGIDALLAFAEKSRADRERWFETALTPMLKKQFELLAKMAA